MGDSYQLQFFALAQSCFADGDLKVLSTKHGGVTVRDLSYPPASATKLGRVNRPNRPFFYCSASQEVIYYEIPGLSEGDELVLSYWRIKDTMLVHNIGYTQFVFDQKPYAFASGEINIL